MMKVIVTGAKGLLGSDVMDALKRRGHQAVGLDIEELDITKRDMVLERFEEEKPDAVIHCAAWTAVDAAEEEANREICHRINVGGTRFVAEACRADERTWQLKYAKLAKQAMDVNGNLWQPFFFPYHS